MRVISFAMIRDFIAKHADADVALRDWYKRTLKQTGRAWLISRKRSILLTMWAIIDMCSTLRAITIV